MSLEEVRPGVWRVRWREGKRNRARIIGPEREARIFEARVILSKRSGEPLAIDTGRATLDEFYPEYWRRHAVPNLAPSTRALYKYLLAAHIVPRFGPTPLRDIGTEAIDEWRAEMLRKGKGRVATAKAITLLGAILGRAVAWGQIERNPVRLVSKPPQGRERPVQILPPQMVEQLRARLIASARHGDATLVSVLAYAGVRPGEVWSRRWSDVRERTLLVEAPKTGRVRAVKLLGPVASDLAQWRLRSSLAGDGDLVFPLRGGGQWTKTNLGNWRRRIFDPAVEALGYQDAVPYDLRHTCASLMFWAGRPVTYVADQLGHSPAMCLRTYAHVMRELEEGERVSEEEAIRRARVKVAERREAM